MEKTEINKPIPKFQDASIAPMHTCEHLVNQTMVRLFGCGRVVSAHVERKKSKLDFALPQCPTPEEIAGIQKTVNEVIAQNLPIRRESISREAAKERFDLKRLPEEVSEVVQIVKIGEYDECLCIGSHVENTSEIGRFIIASTHYENGIFRMRFKLQR